MNRPVRNLSRFALLAGAALSASLVACNLNQTAAIVDETGEADSVATNVTWWSNAVQFRSSTNLRVAFDCPDSGTASVVWGSGVYTDDSSVCTAGVHAGKITFATGGRVIIEMRPGQASYDSSTRNGVTSRTWPNWEGSFVFP